MFTDARSRRVLLVAHCVLNQNAKIDRCARYPGAMREVAGALAAGRAGLLQLPCPELVCLGLDRGADPAGDRTIASEDTRVARRMAGRQARSVCRRLAEDVIFQLVEYRRNGFAILGLLGIDGSPTCGVDVSWADDREQPGPGIFIRMLADGCRRRDIRLAMRGIRAARPGQALSALEELFAQPAAFEEDRQ